MGHEAERLCVKYRTDLMLNAGLAVQFGRIAAKLKTDFFFAHPYSF
jgi:hypothetical protein